MNLKEELASLEHEQWINWSKSISEDMKILIDIATKNLNSLSKEELEFVMNQIERLERWEILWQPYENLSEELKKEDRVYADKVLNILRKYKYTLRSNKNV